MNTCRRHIIIPFTLLTLFLVGGVALAQIGDGYSLTWWTVDGGGDTVSGGTYTLMATAGQSEPGPVVTGGDYALFGGFWSSGGVTPQSLGNHIYLPLVGRNN